MPTGICIIIAQAQLSLADARIGNDSEAHDVTLWLYIPLQRWVGVYTLPGMRGPAQEDFGARPLLCLTGVVGKLAC